MNADEGAGYWTDLLRQVVDGRPVVVATDVLVSGARLVGQLGQAGVDDVLAMAGTRGTGPVDPETEQTAVLLDLAAGHSVMDGIRAWQRVLDDPPAWARVRLASFDPDGRALVVASLFNTADRVAGREVLGARPWSWVELEDKTTVDALWDAVGVSRAPSRIVALNDPVAVSAAARGLDDGMGTCWVADNTLGWHGGGEYVRWTGPDGDPTDVVAEMDGAARHARVMPFLEGRPCSIHGWVFDEHVVTLRPCEMVVWRDDHHRFVYGGAATTWEPPASERVAMRDVARRVGTHLRHTVGYRGVFTVDGILTSTGFRPTELNPRYGGALERIAEGADLPLYLLHLASVHRPDLPWRPEELEELVLAAADASPVGRVMMWLSPEARLGTWHLGRGPADEWVDVRADDPAEAIVTVGPALGGARMAIVHLPGLARGQAAAPVGAELRGAISDRVGVVLGHLDAAADSVAG